MANPITAIRRFFGLVLTICMDIIGGAAMGYSIAGFRGAFNAVKCMLRRDCGRRADGLLLPSPHFVEGVSMPTFSWMDESLWKEALDR